MASTRFSDWAADGSSPALSRRRGGPALRVQDARPQQRRESPRRRRYGCALLLFCEELLSLHRVQVESTRGLTVLADHAATANGGVHTRVKVTKRSTPGNFFKNNRLANRQTIVFGHTFGELDAHEPCARQEKEEDQAGLAARGEGTR